MHTPKTPLAALLPRSASYWPHELHCFLPPLRPHLILATLDFNPPAVGDFISHALIKDTLNLKLLLKDSFQVGDTIICFVVAVNLVVRDGGPNHVGVRACMRPSRLNCINVIVCKAIGQR